ncbi:hypothetical protein XELAEV_18010531mg [Xenopus laevis]|uniref:Secreted protein n=1 Tax=Xenopus laevis TaxID=8355 RepID=A0A974I1W1_XENLA|nr:hypothetical protein XELAEV_18010531mg [Xenopus laevis]
MLAAKAWTCVFLAFPTAGLKQGRAREKAFPSIPPVLALQQKMAAAPARGCTSLAQAAASTPLPDETGRSLTRRKIIMITPALACASLYTKCSFHSLKYARGDLLKVRKARGLGLFSPVTLWAWGGRSGQ